MTSTEFLLRALVFGKENGLAFKHSETADWIELLHEPPSGTGWFRLRFETQEIAAADAGQVDRWLRQGLGDHRRESAR